MNKDILKENSFCFAVRVVNLYKFLNKEHKQYDLSRQILKLITSSIKTMKSKIN